jgi:hypothetical protein
MKVPFTPEEFFGIFKQYNERIFPLQALFYLLALVILFLVIRKHSLTNKVVSGILAYLWLWMGVVYHLLFFTAINRAAYVFGGIFIVQGVLFFVLGVLQDKLSLNWKPDLHGITGGILIGFALFVYPAIGYALGHVYPAAPGFGLPCPTTIFTFGVLLLCDKKCLVVILIIPLLWSILGFTAALSLGVYQDFGLLIAGVLASALIMIRNFRTKRSLAAAR